MSKNKTKDDETEITVTGIIANKEAMVRLLDLGNTPDLGDETDENPIDGEPNDWKSHLRALAIAAHEALAHIETDSLAHRWDEIHGVAVDGKNTITRLVHAIDDMED